LLVHLHPAHGILRHVSLLDGTAAEADAAARLTGSTPYVSDPASRSFSQLFGERTLSERGLAARAVTNAHRVGDLRDEDHPVARIAGPAARLDEGDEPVDLRVSAHDLQLDDRQIPIPLDHP